MGMSDTIEINDLSLHFDGKWLYDGFSMHVGKGEKVTLAGESGTGKTTLVHLVLGFIPFVSGSVKVLDRPLHCENIEYIRSQIAFVPQELHLPLQTARELFYMPFSFRQNRQHRPARPTVERTLDALGLPAAILEKNLDEISGGQKQRIAIASALLLDKPLMILDEPTASLDSKSIGRLVSLVFGENGGSVLSTSHNQSWTDHSDRIYNLDEHATNT